MICVKVASLAPYSHPSAGLWDTVAKTVLELVPAPLSLQPTAYIRVSWENRAYGAVEQAALQAVHDGTRMAFRLDWAASAPNSGAGEGFADAAALGFAVRGDPVLTEMGSNQAPMHMLYWSALRSGVRSIGAAGIGSSIPAASCAQHAEAGWSQGRWRLVISRDMAGGPDISNLVAGQRFRLGLALWNGGNEERAGIKAITPDWSELEIEA